MINKTVIIAIVKYRGLDECFFKESLHSALSQKGIKFEIHIYLEGVETPKISDSRVAFIHVPKALYAKPSKIRQFIIKNTKSELLAFWDSDDTYAANRLETQVNLITKNKLDLCFANFDFMKDHRIEKKNSFFDIIGYKIRKINIFDENYIGLGVTTARVSFLKQLLPFPDIRLLDWWIGIKGRLSGLKLDIQIKSLDITAFITNH